MTGKRLLGFLFIVLAILFSISVLVQIPLLIKALAGLIRMRNTDEAADSLGVTAGYNLRVPQVGVVLFCSLFAIVE